MLWKFQKFAKVESSRSLTVYEILIHRKPYLVLPGIFRSKKIMLNSVEKMPSIERQLLEKKERSKIKTI